MPEELRGARWSFNNCYQKTILSINIQNTQINGWDGTLTVERDGVVAPSLTCTNECDCMNPSCIVYPTTTISLDGNNNTWYSAEKPVVCIDSAVCVFKITSMHIRFTLD